MNVRRGRCTCGERQTQGRESCDEKLVSTLHEGFLSL
jgi:hypothetical protein